MHNVILWPRNLKGRRIYPWLLTRLSPPLTAQEDMARMETRHRWEYAFNVRLTQIERER